MGIGCEYLKTPVLSSKVFPNERMFKVLEHSMKQYPITLIQGFYTIGKTYTVSGWIESRGFGDEILLWFDAEKATEELVHILENYLNHYKKNILLIVDHLEAIITKPLGERVLLMLDTIRDNVRMVVITKGKIPEQWIGFLGRGLMNLIPGIDIMLQEDEMKAYVGEYRGEKELAEIDFYPSYLPKIPLAINIFIVYLKGFHGDKSLAVPAAVEKVYEFIDMFLVKQWTSELRELIMRLIPYQHISREVIIKIYGDDSRFHLIEKYAATCCLVMKMTDDSYFFIGYLQKYLTRICKNYMEPGKNKEIYYEAASYYEEEEKYDEALGIYERLNDYDSMAEMIYRMILKKKFCKNRELLVSLEGKLPEEVYIRHPGLCYWRIIKVLLHMNVAGAVSLYKRVSEYRDTLVEEEQLRKEYEACLFVLNLFMPTSTCDELEEEAERYYGNSSVDNYVNQLLLNPIVLLSMFFCFKKWCNMSEVERLIKNEEFASLVGMKIVALLKMHIGFGYLNMGEEEKALFYLREATYKSYINNMRVMQAYGEVLIYTMGGRRFYEEEDMERCMRSIEMWKEELYMLPDVEKFFLVRYYLKLNDMDHLDSFYSRFDILGFQSALIYNYRDQLNLIRMNMLLEDYYGALMQIDMFLEFAKEYNWEMEIAECYILKSIIYYRRKEYESMLEVFMKGYFLIKQYRYACIVIDERGAVLPVLEMVMEINRVVANQMFFKKLYEQSKRYAKEYPDYLVGKKVQTELFRPEERKVLQGLELNVPLSELVESLDKSLSEIKAMRTEIYRKLNVTGKAQAVRAAKELGYL